MALNQSLSQDFKKSHTSYLRTEQKFQQLNNEFEIARREGDIDAQGSYVED